MLCFLGILLLVARPSHTRDEVRLTEEEELIEMLFKNYNPSARPVLNSSDTVNVGIQFSLLQIQDLNVRNQVFTVTGLLILRWKDERLVWDKQFSNIDQLVLEGSKIWKPEFALINGAEGIYDDFGQFQARISSTGDIKWEPGGVFKTMCSIDITYYPFDEQQCGVKFGAWSYYTTKMNITTNVSTITTLNYEENGEWAVPKTEVVREEFAFLCCPDERFSFVNFTVFLRRRHTFYLMNVITPSMMTSAVLLSIFFCVPTQKVHIGVAALLSFRLFLLNVADNIPRTSDHIPLLGIYLTCTMAITTLAMVATVFVLNLYHYNETPVPKWAKVVFFQYISRVLCMCNCVAPDQKEPPEILTLMTHHKHFTNRKLNVIANRHSQEVAECVPMRRIHRYADTTVADMTPSEDEASSPSSPEHNGAHQQTTTPKNCDTTQEDRFIKPNYAKDWKKVAEVFDRLFFFLSLIAILATTLLLFHPLTTGKLAKLASNL